MFKLFFFTLKDSVVKLKIMRYEEINESFLCNSKNIYERSTKIIALRLRKNSIKYKYLSIFIR